MIILGIETSCDETALSVIESTNRTDITVLADKTLTQIALHQQYGGVFPNMAKREHSRNLVPLLKTVLEEAGFENPKHEIRNSKQNRKPKSEILNAKRSTLDALLEREPELLEQFLEFIPTIEKPPIDAIAATVGPGLEPCLWTGINLAKALSLVWDIPIVPVNHMEGHIFSSMLVRKEISNSPNYLISNENPKDELGTLGTAKGKSSAVLHNSQFILHSPSYPSLALLISGGHTELVLIKKDFEYEVIGHTRDDAVGEAFDKVARLLGLPYPGGPQISRLAEELRTSLLHNSKFILHGITLPRPMLHSPDFDFSFSGIKTSVLYLIKKLPELTDALKKEIALEFENAVTEVLIAKTKKAIEQFGAQTLLLGGGVVANGHIRREFEKLAKEQTVPIFIPEKSLTTDNALMIAVVGAVRAGGKIAHSSELSAKGNLCIDDQEIGSEPIF